MKGKLGGDLVLTQLRATTATHSAIQLEDITSASVEGIPVS